MLTMVQEKKKQEEVSERMQRSMQGGIRTVENEDRVVEITFSSEEPYTRWWGVEILDHSEGCMVLERLKSTGCVLFNHNRDYVIAKIEKVWCDGNRGHAKIRFDEDEKSDAIYQKVKGGTLKGVSIGYTVNVWEEVGVAKKSADGRFTGPCSIAKRWEPYEISVVSVPADQTVGVGRGMQGRMKTADENGKYVPTIQERQLQINENLD